MKRYERVDLLHTLNTLERVLLASVVGGKLAEKTVRNLSDEVSLAQRQAVRGDVAHQHAQGPADVLFWYSEFEQFTLVND